MKYIYKFQILLIKAALFNISIKCNKFPIIYSWIFLIRHLRPVLHLNIYSLSVRIFYCKIVAYESSTGR